jgi:hypothetical protein
MCRHGSQLDLPELTPQACAYTHFTLKTKYRIVFEFAFTSHYPFARVNP